LIARQSGRVMSAKDTKDKDKGKAAEAAADDAAGEGADTSFATKPAKKGGLKKLIVMAGLPLLLIGGGAGLYLSGMLDSLLGGEAVAEGEAAEHAEGEAEAAELEPSEAFYFEVPEMTVNLQSDGRRPAFLQVRIVLELATEEDLHEVERVMPRVIDQFQTYLRELRAADLEGSAGVYRLREEMMARVNAAVAPAQITDVLFEKMLVQG
jgi:flagellar FliL protein